MIYNALTDLLNTRVTVTRAFRHGTTFDPPKMVRMVTGRVRAVALSSASSFALLIEVERDLRGSIPPDRRVKSQSLFVADVTRDEVVVEPEVELEPAV